MDLSKRCLFVVIWFLYVFQFLSVAVQMKKLEDGTKTLLKRKDVMVGYLATIRGDLTERQGLAISGAISLALEEINNDPMILPNVSLKLLWNDTRSDTNLTLHIMDDMIHKGASVFFGPEGSCFEPARFAYSSNIPMISYKCSDYEALKMPTFAQLEPSIIQVSDTVISLLSYYNWNEFSIIYENSWRSMAYILEHQAKQRNLSINNIRNVTNVYTCCEQMMDCCFVNSFEQVVTEIKEKSRIFVFLGRLISLNTFMNAMENANLFDDGEYMVIYVDLNVYSSTEALMYFWRPQASYTLKCPEQSLTSLKRNRSLLVVTLSQMADNYAHFQDAVRKYNSKPPFNFAVPHLMSSAKLKTTLPIYAAYLYDGVKLYARALHNILNEQPELSDEAIDKVIKNGTKIIQTMTEFKMYSSITGSTIYIDKHGGGKGNFSVLAVKKVDDPSVTLDNLTCSYQMIPVGLFGDDHFPVFKICKQIEWPNNIKPSDKVCTADRSKQES